MFTDCKRCVHSGKQRFFVPTDEETGVAVLTELLARYPVMVSNALADEEPTEPAELTPPQIVNLDAWFVPIAMVQPREPEFLVSPIAREIEEAESALTLPAFYFVRRSDVQCDVEETQLALDFG